MPSHSQTPTLKKRLVRPICSWRFAPPSFIAEGEGFEPSVTQGATPVFETDPFNHSGTPPIGAGSYES